ncbi:unnamed protein product [Chilo suppressalis]|uniref:Gustatory receptor n=1 Tax=Chilo suppressalis TaxID=168631 RepID=A0ABN8B427_CHISP|nr:unnamed protein product [Chilo suppressalis]
MEFEELDSWTENRRILRDVVVRAVLMPFISVLFKIVVSAIYCAHADKRDFCTLTFFEFLMKVVSNYAFDSLLLVQYMIMYTYYRHMSNLKSKVVTSHCDANKTLRVYRNILDSVDRIKPVFDKLILTGIIIAVPRFMTTEYMVLHEVKTQQNWVLLTVQYAVVLQMGILMSVSTLAAEAVNTHADEISLTLHNNLIGTTDQQKRFEIQQTLVYMSARPSQLYVWRRIPVDARLPMAIISVMTTYLIVIVQFTHLFD